MGKTLSSLRGKIEKMDNILSFSIPESKVVQYNINGTPSNLEEMQWDEHAALYIWKMTPDNKGIYNTESIEWMLRFAAIRKKQEKPIHIVLGPELYATLAEDREEEFFSYTSQEILVQNIAEEVWLSASDIHIEDMASMHEALFTALKTHGIDSLNETTPLREKWEVSSLDIAQHLYTLSLKHPELQKLFFNTVPSELKKKLPKNHPLWYYGLIEIACRLFDFKQGITMQGWVVRQKKYDDVLLELLDSDSASMPALTDLQWWLQKQINISDTPFSTWYFKNKTYLDLLPKEKEKQQLKSKLTNLTAIVSIAVASALLGWTSVKLYNEHQTKKKERTRQEYLMKQKLEHETVWVWIGSVVDYNSYASNEKKIQLLQTTANNVYYYLIDRYDIDPHSQKIIKSIIKDALLESDQHGTLPINTINSDIDEIENRCHAFIEQDLVPQHAIALTTAGMDIRPYSKWITHKNTFEETVNMHEQFTVTGSFAERDWGNNPLDRFGASVESLGTFTNSDNKKYELKRVRIDKNSMVQVYHKEFIVARPLYDGTDTYTTDTAKLVAKELLEIRDK